MEAQLPSIWREELLHPLSVHFPVVLLSLAVLSHFLGIILKNNKYYSYILVFKYFFLLSGTISGWLAIFAGEMAEDVVNKLICDPTVTHEHEDLTRNSILIFSALSLFYLAKLKFSLDNKIITLVETLLFIGGIYFLATGAHLGVTLVYQQGAAVYRTTPECKEFE
ncbi:MAG: hypothetical protein KBC84_01410 [Proteobacteria bacterium]|nr:hypothetical protein [Pseudomonadota bacterium]